MNLYFLTSPSFAYCPA